MKGFPKTLKTKDDYYNCLAMVAAGELKAADLLAKIEGLEKQRYIYQYYYNSLAALMAGGRWGSGAQCGARAVRCNYYPWHVNTFIGARGACDSL